MGVTLYELCLLSLSRRDGRHKTEKGCQNEYIIHGRCFTQLLKRFDSEVNVLRKREFEEGMGKHNMIYTSINPMLYSHYS